MFDNILSLAFLLAGMVYIFLGIYSISLDKKSTINKTFFFQVISYSLWAFAFAFSNSAESLETAILWRRVASLGWGSAFCFSLHFVLLLNKKHKWLNNGLLYIFIYSPAILNYYVFCFSPNANLQYNLVKTPAGWGNILVNNFGDKLFCSYVLIYGILIVGSALRVMIKGSPYMSKKNGRILFIACFLGLLVGIFTDIIFNNYFDYIIPSMAPIALIIPMSVILFFIKKIDLLQSEKHIEKKNENQLLNEVKRAQFFKYISGVFFLGSLLNIIYFFFRDVSWNISLVFSLVLMAMASAVFLLPFTNWNHEKQDDILSLIIGISIPLTIFRFLKFYGSILVWPIPLIFMMITIIFNNKKMFRIIAIVTLGTGAISWALFPRVNVQVRSLEYSLRMIYYIIGIVLSYYISQVYSMWIDENRRQVNFQKMISSISTDFLSLNIDNYNEKFYRFLEKTSEYLAASSSSIIKVLENENEIISKYKMEDINYLDYDRLLTDLDKDDDSIFIENLENDFGKVLFIPVEISEKSNYVISYNLDKNYKSADLDSVMIKVIANILKEALKKLKIEKKMNYLAYNDVLTGLPNRLHFNNSLKKEMSKATEEGTLIGVLFLDLDDFKSINDSLGHNAGDKVLELVAAKLKKSVRSCDLVARFGGDEFLVMINNINSIELIEKVALKIVKEFNESMIIRGQEFFVSLSLGISIYPYDGVIPSELIKNADLAMYHAKKSGKNQFANCSYNLQEEILKKIQLTNALYRAVERGEIELHYQPQIDIKTKTVVGIEALIRWNHPEFGYISPEEFIPIAEETGLINSIGLWVLKKACYQNKIWQNSGMTPMKVAVNVSLKQLKSIEFLNYVKEALDESSLDPKYLEIEITEGIASEECSYLIDTLHSLKKIGVDISIDDFGTKYSSLSRLKELPVDKLKMDMEFIQGIQNNIKDQSIVSVIINLAKSLGLKVIAEGVETKEQLIYLTEESCDEVQGFYYYKPMDNLDIEETFKKRD